MAQYIPKEPLLAEIERRMEEDVSLDGNGGFASYMDFERYSTLESILSFVKEELEVKEVDLEKEIEEHVIGMPMSEFTHDSEVEGFWDWARKEFRHFFELGIKAQKGE